MLNLNKFNISLQKYKSFASKLAITLIASTLIIAPASAAALGVTTLSATATSAQITDPNPTPSDEFGYSMATNGDGSLAVVGSPGSTDSGNNAQAGTAYIFKNVSGVWSEVAQLTPNTHVASAQFGSSVAITSDGTQVVIGAIGDNGFSSGSGAAYVFNQPAGGWDNLSGTPQVVLQTFQLIGSDNTYGSNFGYSLAITNGTVTGGLPDSSLTVVIGANNQTSLSANTGAGEGYVFNIPTSTVPTTTPLSQKEIIGASDNAVSSHFGYSVSLSQDGSEIAVGSPNQGGTGQGSAYLFSVQPAGWVNNGVNNQSSEIMNTLADRQNRDYFGVSLSLSSDGTRLIVGAPLQTVSSVSQGAAFVFNSTAGTFAETAELDVSDGQTSDFVGYSVNMASDGSSVIVGAPNHVLSGMSQAGTSYEFDNSSSLWAQSQELAPQSVSAGLDFGWSVFLVKNATVAVVGAPAITATSSPSTTFTSSKLAKSNVLFSKMTAISSKSLSNLSPTGVNGKAYAFYNTTAPSIVDINPSSVPASTSVGTRITLSGSNLQGTSKVTFTGGVTAPVISNTSSSIVVNVPIGALTGVITVVTANGTTASPVFTITQPAPVVTSITPSSYSPLLVNKNVVIAGTNLSNASVTLNGVALTIIRNTPIKIKVSVPTTATSGYLVVTTPGGVVTSPVKLKILYPTVSSLSNTSLTAGLTLTIHGTNLGGTTTVVFTSGKQAVISSITQGAVNVIVPIGVTLGPITITSANGSVITTPNFL